MLEGTKDAVFNVNGKTFAAGANFGGTVKVDIKNYQGALTNISGSNKTQASYLETAKPQISVTLNSVPDDILAQLTGATKTDGGLYTNNIEKLPHVGLVASALRFGTDKDRAFVFPNCAGTVQNFSLSTDTDSKKTMATIQIDFNALWSDKINASGGYMDVPSDDLSSVYTMLGWNKPDNTVGDFNADSASKKGSAPVSPEVHAG